jgi:hypothetical protein
MQLNIKGNTIQIFRSDLDFLSKSEIDKIIKNNETGDEDITNIIDKIIDFHREFSDFPSINKFLVLNNYLNINTNISINNTEETIDTYDYKFETEYNTNSIIVIEKEFAELTLELEDIGTLNIDYFEFENYSCVVSINENTDLPQVIDYEFIEYDIFIYINGEKYQL